LGFLTWSMVVLHGIEMFWFGFCSFSSYDGALICLVNGPLSFGLVLNGICALFSCIFLALLCVLPQMPSCKCINNKTHRIR
jgi:hypothetical protein